MIGVRINGQPLDLAPKTKVLWEFNNPYLLYDRIESSKASFPSIPFSDNNQRVFEYYHEPQASVALGEFDCEQYFGGELIRAGYFILTEASERGGYVGAFTDRLGKFFGDFQTKLLTEIDFGSVAVPTVLTPTLSDALGQVCCFPTILNPDFYGTNGTGMGYSGKVNDYASGAYTTTGPKVPMISVKWLLQKIAAVTGTTIEGDFLTHPVWQHLIMYNTRALDAATEVVIKNHLPELTLEQFLIELRKLPNLMFTFNSPEKKLRIDFWEDRLAAVTTKNWTAKLVAGGIKTPEMNRRLQLGSEQDGGDGLMKDKPALTVDYLTPELAEPTGIAVLKSKFSTLLVDESTGYPVAKQAGITEQFQQTTNKFAPRLLFWHGLADGRPKALPSKDGIALYWTGATGLAAQYWQRTEAMKATAFYLKTDLMLNESDLAQLDFGTKYHLDGVDYLIASLAAELPISKPVGALLMGGG